MLEFLDIELITVDSKHAGTLHFLRDLFQTSVKTIANSSAQHFRIAQDTKSGPAAFLLLCLCSRFLTSYSSLTKGGVRELASVGCLVRF